LPSRLPRTAAGSLVAARRQSDAGRRHRSRPVIAGGAAVPPVRALGRTVARGQRLADHVTRARARALSMVLRRLPADRFAGRNQHDDSPRAASPSLSGTATFGPSGMPLRPARCRTEAPRRAARRTRSRPLRLGLRAKRVSLYQSPPRAASVLQDAAVPRSSLLGAAFELHLDDSRRGLPHLSYALPLHRCRAYAAPRRRHSLPEHARVAEITRARPLSNARLRTSAVSAHASPPAFRRALQRVSSNANVTTRRSRAWEALPMLEAPARRIPCAPRSSPS
jgi:hypothetical protein